MEVEFKKGIYLEEEMEDASIVHDKVRRLHRRCGVATRCTNVLYLVHSTSI
jgi:hypothetical protein